MKLSVLWTYFFRPTGVVATFPDGLFETTDILAPPLAHDVQFAGLSRGQGLALLRRTVTFDEETP